MNREPHFDENEVLRQCMSPLNEEVPDMPENFHAQWTALVKEDAMKQEETRKVAPDAPLDAHPLRRRRAGVRRRRNAADERQPVARADECAAVPRGELRLRLRHLHQRRRLFGRRAGSGVRTMMVSAANDAMPGSRQREIRRCGGQENHPQRVADHQNIRL